MNPRRVASFLGPHAFSFHLTDDHYQKATSTDTPAPVRNFGAGRWYLAPSDDNPVVARSRASARRVAIPEPATRSLYAERRGRLPRRDGEFSKLLIYNLILLVFLLLA